jgi:hypothetical protein
MTDCGGDIPMKKPKVDVEEVAMIMDNQGRFGAEYYLDKETGETVAIPDELMRALDEEDSPEDLPKWELELLPVAKEIFEGSERYEEIPTRPSGEAYRIRVDFTANVRDPKLRSKLGSSLQARGAFRRFRDTLCQFPEEEKKWFRFQAEKDKEEVKDWLAGIGIELEE